MEIGIYLAVLMIFEGSDRLSRYLTRNLSYQRLYSYIHNSGTDTTGTYIMRERH
jgi:hypothetical protein